MQDCDWCNLSEQDKRFLLYDSPFWSVFLSDEQDDIGRCILVLKRHCGSLPKLTDEEMEGSPQTGLQGGKRPENRIRRGTVQWELPDERLL